MRMPFLTFLFLKGRTWDFSYIIGIFKTFIADYERGDDQEQTRLTNCIKSTFLSLMNNFEANKVEIMPSVGVFCVSALISNVSPLVPRILELL